MNLIAAGACLQKVTVAEVVAPNSIVLKESEFCGIFTALNLFRQHSIRHLPIVGESGDLIGLVTQENSIEILQQEVIQLQHKQCELLDSNSKLEQAENALRQSEARYRAIVEDQTELICRYLPDGKMTFVNQAYCRYFGVRPSEVLNKTFVSSIVEEDRAVLLTLATTFGRSSVTLEQSF